MICLLAKKSGMVLLGLMAVFLMVHGADAGTYTRTWDGGGGDSDPVLSSDINWVDDSALSFWKYDSNEQE